MKKSFVLMSLFLLSFPVFAVATEVKITSFIYTANNANLAELCGTVSNATGAKTFVQIVVDSGSKHPATYNTFAGQDGHFCMMVTTYTGEAAASVIP